MIKIIQYAIIPVLSVLGSTSNHNKIFMEYADMYLTYVKETTVHVTKLKLNSMALARKRTIPTERPPLAGELVPTFADRGRHVVSAMDPHGR
jgi:hypothetical protein